MQSSTGQFGWINDGPWSETVPTLDAGHGRWRHDAPQERSLVSVSRSLRLFALTSHTSIVVARTIASPLLRCTWTATGARASSAARGPCTPPHATPSSPSQARHASSPSSHARRASIQALSRHATMPPRQARKSTPVATVPQACHMMRAGQAMCAAYMRAGA